MMNVDQFRNYVVRPTLSHMGMWSQAAEDLIVGTAATESHMGTYIKQVGGGPALGIMQMEVETHDDIWMTWLSYRRTESQMMRGIVGERWWDPIMKRPRAHALIGNMEYAVAMARLKYRRISAAIPAAGDWDALGEYWLKWYNGGGKGSMDKWHRDLLRCGVTKEA